MPAAAWMVRATTHRWSAPRPLNLARARSAIAADVSKDSDVDAAVSAVLDRWGRLDGLLNIAGILRTGNILTTTTDDWATTLDVNLRGSMMMSQAAVRHWVDANSPGRVVNVTSTAGLEGVPDMFAYSVSKAALIGLTLAAANEVACKGILINAIAPTAGTRMAILRTRRRGAHGAGPLRALARRGCATWAAHRGGGAPRCVSSVRPRTCNRVRVPGRWRRVHEVGSSDGRRRRQLRPERARRLRRSKRCSTTASEPESRHRAGRPRRWRWSARSSPLTIWIEPGQRLPTGSLRSFDRRIVQWALAKVSPPRRPPKGEQTCQRTP